MHRNNIPNYTFSSLMLGDTSLYNMVIRNILLLRLYHVDSNGLETHSRTHFVVLSQHTILSHSNNLACRRFHHCAMFIYSLSINFCRVPAKERVRHEIKHTCIKYIVLAKWIGCVPTQQYRSHNDCCRVHDSKKNLI